MRVESSDVSLRLRSDSTNKPCGIVTCIPTKKFFYRREGSTLSCAVCFLYLFVTSSQLFFLPQLCAILMILAMHNELDRIGTSGPYVASIDVVFHCTTRAGGRWWRHVGQRFCCYVRRSDVVSAAHRCPYNTNLPSLPHPPSTHSHVSALTFIVDHAAFRHTIARSFPSCAFTPPPFFFFLRAKSA